MDIIMKHGYPMRKGVSLSSERVDANIALYEKWYEHFLLYPDLFLDLIQRDDDKFFHLTPYQRVALRASMRYRYHSWTATRAASKSFTTYLAAILRCSLVPNTTVMLVSDVKGTVIKIAKQKSEEIFRHWPLLRAGLKDRAEDGTAGERKSNDAYELSWKNGSFLSVVSKDTSRGLRANYGIVEESALMDGTDYAEVILPQLNVPRRCSDGYLNPDEPLAPIQYITTAASKTCWMYSRLIEMVIDSIDRPNEFFIWGFDYTVPVHYGLISKQQMEDQRYSTTIDQDSFARESMSIWTGASKEAWFDNSVISRRRTLMRCEREARPTGDSFYIISTDVGRLQCKTAISVIKVVPADGGYKKKVVYLEVIDGESFILNQAPRLKELIEIYEPREVVIDANGMGIGLMDAMAVPSTDPRTGRTYPAYFAFNVESHLPPTMKNTVDEPVPANNAILYALKANAGDDKNDAIHANIFAQFTNGSVSLLARETIVKEKLMATKKGQKMDLYDRRVFLLPYEMTSRLVDEMLNLRVKPTGNNNQLAVEQISKAIDKDRFSSLEYGLWRVKHYEDKLIRKKKRKIDGKYSFFTPRKRG